jgi:putative transcriptional regulator
LNSGYDHEEGPYLPTAETTEYTYLTIPPVVELRSCVGLVMAGMAMRARVGIGGLEEAVELLESYHSQAGPTRYRFSLGEESVLAEVEEPTSEGGPEGESGWRMVVELVS